VKLLVYVKKTPILFHFDYRLLRQKLKNATLCTSKHAHLLQRNEGDQKQTATLVRRNILRRKTIKAFQNVMKKRPERAFYEHVFELSAGGI
jgi:hypothetical protein